MESNDRARAVNGEQEAGPTGPGQATAPGRLLPRILGKRLSARVFSARAAILLSAFVVIAIPVAVLAYLWSAGYIGPGKDVKDSSSRGPDFELALFGNANHPAGQVVRLSSFQGQPVVLHFWFPSCQPCQSEMRELEVLSQRYRSRGLQVIGVQMVWLDSPEEGQDVVSRLGVTYALGPDRDREIIDKYGITAFPSTVFLDRDHNILRTWTGSLDAGRMEEFLLEALK